MSHKDNPYREVKMCQYKLCDKPASVFITTTFSTYQYCEYHFGVTLFKGDKANKWFKETGAK